MRQPRGVRGIENRRRRRRDGTIYWTFRVRWINPITGARESEEFDDQQEAIDFKATLRLAKRGGRVSDMSAGKALLADFVEQEWWPKYACVELEQATLISYASVWNLHVLPHVGGLPLRQLDPAAVAALRRTLEDAGVGTPTIRKALAMLQSVCSTAVTWGRITTNPVAAVRKPRVNKPTVKAMSVLTIEQIADRMPDQASRVLVYLVGYQRLRPEEALALQNEHVGRRTLVVEQKNVDGEIYPWQKVGGMRPRSVSLLKPVGAELAALKMERGPALPSAFVLARADGKPWREHDYRNWRRRVYKPAAEAVGVEAPGRPYRLRHAGVSLLLREGKLSIADLAAENGHSVETMLADYSHVIAEFKNQRSVPVERQIADARRKIAKRRAA
jgi:integrase